jgi:DNA repair protein RecN (Recombination protein N)
LLTNFLLMLLSLKVQNYALIDHLHVEFHNGLNIITGETGAGKSILLGALGLILGKRAELGVLSDKEKKCVVEAEFDVKDYDLESLFKENDVDYEQHTVIRREILSSGKSRAFINDTPVNLGKLQELAMQLVDIHSQHQNLLLNQKGYLLGLIDKYARLEGDVKKMGVSFFLYKEQEKEYLLQKENYETVKQEYDFISHQFNELDKAKLQPSELQILEEELSELDNLGDIKKSLGDSLTVINTEESGLADQLSGIKHNLTKISGVYSRGSEFLQRVESVAIELKDIQDEMSQVFECLEFDPERFDKVKNRVDLINTLLQKYKAASVEELIELREGLKDKVTVAIDGEYELDKLKEMLENKRGELVKESEALSNKRKSCFKEFSVSVEEYMKNLGLEHARLKIEHNIQELTSTGIDNLQFVFSANKNQALQDVSKIASGGEMSRLMLAIKSVMSDSTGMPTLILDEIDTGVSGEIANKVGNILQSVNKDHTQKLTRTLIKKLDETERVREIAKMLSGDELSEAALENAKVLLNN